ncbi:MAG: uracil-DNA glycosylase [Oscillospiraceae bacterium]|nr:uracil-DNA glycosylase [Oscillospiraceae bacterium]
MADTWEKLKAECAACAACPLAQTRTNLVFGVGREDAEILFIGEGPGEQEDLQGEPFVGPAGKLLDTMLAIIGLDRSKVYIINMVKCRPPRNRDPQEDEIAACAPWLQRQIALVDPKLIVCLGRVAAKGLIDPEFRITRQHGQWYRCGDRPIMATYHPSALLRDPSKRPEAFMDLRELRKEIRAVCERTELYDDTL